ncbi:hypothetical protein FB563_7090 [Streptomyces puniciscabiei]|uniref:Uncharacterized protein n=1 Tax=Streptomyces puniciscabiei TaxID=164348 RepID=A0A542TJB4_9ACTN|nr:hypothetical protein FB563_7090 [Streptomyces puniciscabiei]
MGIRRLRKRPSSDHVLRPTSPISTKAMKAVTLPRFGPCGAMSCSSSCQPDPHRPATVGRAMLAGSAVLPRLRPPDGCHLLDAVRFGPADDATAVTGTQLRISKKGSSPPGSGSPATRTSSSSSSPTPDTTSPAWHGSQTVPGLRPQGGRPRLTHGPPGARVPAQIRPGAHLPAVRADLADHRRLHPAPTRPPTRPGPAAPVGEPAASSRLTKHRNPTGQALDDHPAPGTVAGCPAATWGKPSDARRHSSPYGRRCRGCGRPLGVGGLVRGGAGHVTSATRSPPWMGLRAAQTLPLPSVT